MSTPFDISGGNTGTFADPNGGDGLTINVVRLDNSFNAQINGVEVFTGGPASNKNPNELQFSPNNGELRTVQFKDGSDYQTQAVGSIWSLGNNTETVLKLVIQADGDVFLFGIKSTGGPLEELQLINGLTVNKAAIAAAWNPSGPNQIALGQSVDGPTYVRGAFESFEDFAGAPICFGEAALISTPDGAVPVADLTVGDRVLTVDGPTRKIRWICKRKITARQLAKNPKLYPVRIRAGSLGAGLPSADLLVSRQHRMLVRSDIAGRMFGGREILVPAIQLIDMPAIERAEDVESITYYHMLFDQHEVIYANGAPSESLFTGPEALESVTPEQREEIETLFPEICDPEFIGVPARHIPKKGKHIRKLVERHIRNAKPLVSRH